MKVLVLFVIVSLTLITRADNFMQDRQDLQRLIAERAARFNSYTESLKMNSGIFGNKTKADIKRSNEVLIEIVTTDNKLIDAMNRILSYKTFEKTNTKYESAKNKEKLQQSMSITDTLTKQLDKLQLENKQLHSKNIKLKGLVYLFLAGLLVVMYLFHKMKKKMTEINN